MENSPFRKLPQEVRHMIYKYALTKPYPIELLAASTSTSSRLPQLLPAPIPYIPHAHLLALTTVCLELHTESVPVLLQENTFRIITRLDIPSRSSLTLRTFDLHAARALSLSNAKLGLWLLGLDENLPHLRAFQVQLSPSPVLRFERMVATYRMCGAVFSIVQRQSGVDVTLNLRVPCFNPLGMGGWFEMQFMGSDTSVARIGLEESEMRLRWQVEENRKGLTPAQMQWVDIARKADVCRIQLLLGLIEMHPRWWRRVVRST